MQRSIHQRLDALSYTDLSDAMDRLKILCQCTDIKPLDRSFSLTGKAWTLRYGPVGLEGGSVGDGHRRRCPIAASAQTTGTTPCKPRAADNPDRANGVSKQWHTGRGRVAIPRSRNRVDPV